MTLRLRDNPVLRKELLVRLRFGRMPRIQRIGILIAIVILLAYVYYQVFNALRADPTPANGRTAWMAIVCLQFAFICLLAPIVAANAISQEREQRTWDMLIFTLLRPAEIIWGKLLARLLPILLVLVLGLPAALFALFFADMGKPDSSAWISPLLFLAVYVVEFLVGLFFAVFGMFMSWLLKRTLYAIIASYTFVIAGLIVGTTLITLMLQSIVGDWNFVTECPLMWFNPIMLMGGIIMPAHSQEDWRVVFGLSGYVVLTALMLWRMIAGFRQGAFEG